MRVLAVFTTASKRAKEKNTINVWNGKMLLVSTRELLLFAPYVFNKCLTFKTVFYSIDIYIFSGDVNKKFISR